MAQPPKLTTVNTPPLDTLNPVSSEDNELMFSGPAVLANRALLAMGPTGIRITFVEQGMPELPAQFRTAVMLPFPEAYDLADILKKMLAPIEQQILAIKAAAEAKANG